MEVLPNYYIRRRGKDLSTGTDRLKDAKIAVKKLAGEDARAGGDAPPRQIPSQSALCLTR